MWMPYFSVILIIQRVYILTNRRSENLLTYAKNIIVYLIVDEAFYDFVTDYESIVPYLSSYSNLTATSLA